MTDTAPMAIDVVEVNSFDDLQTLAEQWNELLVKSETNVVFLTYEYCRSFWEAFGEGRELLVLLARRGGQLMGIAPLAIKRRRMLGWRTRIVEFLAADHSDYADLILGDDKSEVIQGFVDYLMSIRDRWDMMVLRQIPQRSSTLDLAQTSLADAGATFDVVDGVPCSGMMLGENAPDLLETMRKDKKLRRRQRQFEKLGEVEFSYASDSQEGRVYVEALFQQHINRWADSLTPSMFYNRGEQRFYRRMIEDLAPKGWVHLAHLNLNGMPVAMFFGFEYDGLVSIVKQSYDRYYNKYAPGRLLIDLTLSDCIERGLKEFDRLAGVGVYKMDRVNTVRQTRCLHAYRSRVRRMQHRLQRWLRWRWPGPVLYGRGRIGRFRAYMRKLLMQHGLWRLIGLAAHRVYSRVFDVKRNQVLVWCGEPLVEQKPRCPLEIRVASEQDIPLIANLEGQTEDNSYMLRRKERLAKGDRAYVAIAGKAVAHVAWVSRRPEVEATEIFGNWGLDHDEALIRDCATHPVFRGKNIYPAVLQRIMTDLAGEGVRRVYISVSPKNKASVRGVRKAGFSPLRTVLAAKLFGRKLGPETIKPSGK